MSEDVEELIDSEVIAKIIMLLFVSSGVFMVFAISTLFGASFIMIGLLSYVSLKMIWREEEKEEKQKKK